jgi:hypothetical protein
MSAYPIIFGGALVRGPSYDADALAWFSAVEATGANFGASPESITSNKAAFNTAFLSLKSDGIWNSIRQACFLVGPSTVAGALVNIKLSGNPTNNNFASGDYNRLTGLKGNGSNKYLNTNISDSSIDPTDLHIYTQLTDEGTSLGEGVPQFVIGSNYGFSNGNIMAYYFQDAGSRYQRINCNTQTDSFRTGTFVPDTQGKIGFSVSGSTATLWSGNQAWEDDFAGSAGEDPSGNNYFLFRNPASSTTNFNGRSAFYSIGSSIPIANLDQIVETLRGSLVN